MKMFEIAIFAPFLNSETPKPYNLQAEQATSVKFPYKLVDDVLESRDLLLP